jgi:hypothetical protein
MSNRAGWVIDLAHAHATPDTTTQLARPTTRAALAGHRVVLAVVLLTAALRTGADAAGQAPTSPRLAHAVSPRATTASAKSPSSHPPSAERWTMRLIECDESGATLELDAGACWLEPRTGKVCAPGLRAELLPDWSGALPVAVAVLAVPPWARAELGVEPGDLVLRGHIGLRSSQKPLPPSTGRISYQGWIRGQHVC